MHKRLRTGVAMAVGLLVLAAGCSSNSAPTNGGGESASGKNNVVIGISGEIDTPDLAKTTNLLGMQVDNDLFDTITTIDTEFKPQPGVAESWEFSKDGLTWTAKIKHGIKFTNGDEITSEDVAFSFNRLLESKDSVMGAFFDDVEKATVVDKDTIEVTFAKPVPTFISLLSYVPVVPEKVVKEMGEDAFSDKPVGSGPYKFESFVPGKELVLVANPDYRGGEPKIKKVTYRSITEAASRTAALLAGDVDMVQDLSIDQAETVKANDKFAVESQASILRQFLYFDSLRKDSPFGNPKVRQAVNYAINKKAIVDKLLHGYAEINPSALPKDEIGFNETLPGYGYDPAKAKQLLAEAGYPNGFSTDFAFRSSYPKASEVSQAIAANLGDIGIKVTAVNGYDDATFRERTTNHDIAPIGFSGYGGGGIGNSLVWWEVLALCPGSSSIQWDGYYCNKDLEDSYHKTLDTWFSDNDGAVEALKNVDKIYYEDAGAGFLYTLNVQYGMAKNLDWTPRVDGRFFMATAAWK